MHYLNLKLLCLRSYPNDATTLYCALVGRQPFSLNCPIYIMTAQHNITDNIPAQTHIITVTGLYASYT